jgi:predicted nicotinamide N-methyase
MPGYQVKVETVTVGGTDYAIRSLLDSNQYSDPDGEAELAGISPASWPLFGQLWPSARVLARLMDEKDLVGKRILEIGAGLALASLVVHQRAGNVTVSDLHPLSRSFLDENLRLNDLGPLKYETGNWATSNPALGIFDLIIGSDVLYERIHPALVAGFISRHSAPDAEVIIVDPDRGNRPQFKREMQALGYTHSGIRAARLLESGLPYKGCILRFSRSVRTTLS